jgi:hypothetical protein
VNTDSVLVGVLEGLGHHQTYWESDKTNLSYNVNRPNTPCFRGCSNYSIRELSFLIFLICFKYFFGFVFNRKMTKKINWIYYIYRWFLDLQPEFGSGCFTFCKSLSDFNNSFPDFFWQFFADTLYILNCISIKFQKYPKILYGRL